MKKFLSLVLALAMTMSLVTISAGAKDFADADSIQYAEAVDVMSAIGVVDGDTNGNFNPAGGLTRGAAAKIICNLILGPTTAAELNADTNPYVDVDKNSTFAGYIAYCQKANIISGYADGTFKPAAPLTGYAFMKMLLGALGYDGAVEGYTGANWSINVAKQALGIGLNDGLLKDFNGSAYVTREEAMLYAFNTLKATMVSYETTITVGDVTIAGSKAENVAQAGYKNTMGDAQTLQFAEKYFPNLTKTNTTHDVFGRPATEWKYKSDIIGTYATLSDLIATYTAKVEKRALYNLVGSSIANDLGSEKKYDLYIWKNGENVEVPVADYFAKNDSAAAGVSGNGVFTEVYMNEDNDVTVVQYNVYLLQATADYNTTKETLTVATVDIGTSLPALPAKIDNDDFDVADFKEDDYLLVTFADKEIQSVEKAELVTGKVTQWTEDTNVYLDGEKYEYNNIADTTKLNAEYSVNEDAIVVVDANGYIMHVDTAVSNNNFVFVRFANYNTTLNTEVIADGYFTDGTSATLTLNKVDGSTAISHSSVRGWYKFTTTSDGKYNLTRADYHYNTVAANTASEVLVKNSLVKFMNGFTSASTVTGLKANADTLFILREADGTVTTYTGIANAPTVTMPATGLLSTNDVVISYITNKAGSYAEKVFIDVLNAKVTIEDVANVADYLMILKETTKTTYVDGSEYKEYKVIFDGEETTKYIETNVWYDAATSTLIDDCGVMGYNVKANDKGYITNATQFTATSGTREYISMSDATITKSASILTIGSTDYIVDNDTVINLVIGRDATTGVGCALLKNPSADYELYLNTNASTVAGLLKGWEVSGTTYAVVDEAGSQDLDLLYIYVGSAKEVVAASNDTSLASVTVKGVSATLKTDGTYAVVLNNVANVAGGTTKVVAVPTDSHATVSYKVGASDWTTQATGTDAFANDATITITVKAADGTTKDYTLKVTKETAPTLTVAADADAVAVSGTTVTVTDAAGATVSDLLGALSADGCTISVVKAGTLGGTVAAAADDTLAAGMKVVVTTANSGVYEYTVSVVTTSTP